MSVKANPENTYALVVGIEKYDAGPDWDLDGPARDASRFCAWLLRHRVPTDHLFLFLSPLDKNVHLVDETGLASLPATQNAIQTAIAKHLPTLESDLLFFFWGGHGIITVDDERRLFYADATEADKVNLNLNDVRATLRTDYFPGLHRQVFMIDACANYVEHMDPVTTLPSYLFPRGAPLKARGQFLLLAAKAGERARNLSADQTGLFSREVLALLEEEPGAPWPPDMTGLAQRLQRRFNDLRAAGKARQTPVHFSYFDWDVNVHSLGQMAPPAYRAETPVSDQTWIPLPFKKKAELVDALLACATMRDPSKRNVVINNLRSEIYNGIDRDSAARFDVANIVTTCSYYRGGLQELGDTLKWYEPGSEPVRRVVTLIESLG